MDCGIYCITCTENGKVYIGQAVNVPLRWYRHRSKLRRGKHHNTILQRCFDKYGENSLGFSILLECPESELTEWEQYCLDQQRLYDPESVMNFGVDVIAPGKGMKHTEETKARISEANSGERHYQYGKPLTDEAKRKIGAKLKGRKISDDVRNARIGKRSGSKHPMYGKPGMVGESHPMYGKTGEKSPRFGKTLSPESRAKLSASLKAYHQNRKAA